MARPGDNHSTRGRWSLLVWLEGPGAFGAQNGKLRLAAAEEAAATTIEGTTANAEGSHGGVVGDDEARARQAAAILEKRFGVRDLEQLLKARRIAYSGVRKAVMIQRFLNQTSRATDRQIVYMNQLLRANHTLTLNTEEVDSKGAATSWITTAQSDAHERNRVQRERLDQHQTLVRR